ncbi:hypothetical protein PLESTB_000070800 [Pleodorina starrii]|uniref:Uncharacterized protein n=1 Tax=Pleodorina starrii TaxID=330485 RepID=A0A9W6EWM4_9CHLO|nr:hypothetical protein PLESTB_000070800 [Pleodorina starrii]
MLMALNNIYLELALCCAYLEENRKCQGSGASLGHGAVVALLTVLSASRICLRYRLLAPTSGLWRPRAWPRSQPLPRCSGYSRASLFGFVPAMPPVRPIGASAFPLLNLSFSAGLPQLGPAGQDTVYQPGLAVNNQELFGFIANHPSVWQDGGDVQQPSQSKTPKAAVQECSSRCFLWGYLSNSRLQRRLASMWLAQ